MKRHAIDPLVHPLGAATLVQSRARHATVTVTRRCVVLIFQTCVNQAPWCT